MKKTSFVILLLCAFIYWGAPVSAQMININEQIYPSADNFRIESHQNGRLPQTYRQYRWDDNDEWVLFTQVNQTYNVKGEVMSLTFYSPDSTPLSRIFFEYNADGDVTLQTDQNWNIESNTWINHSKLKIELITLLGSVESKVTYHWSTLTYSWEQTSGNRTSFIYDNANRPIETLDEIYQGGQWLNHNRYANTYSGTENLPKTTTRYFWTEGEWLSKGQYVDIVWLNKDERLSYIEKSWNGKEWVDEFKVSGVITPTGTITTDERMIADKWTPLKRSTVTIGELGSTTVTELFKDEAWTPISKSYDSLDHSGNSTFHKLESYVDGKWELTESVTQSNNYNNDGELISTIRDYILEDGAFKIKTEYLNFVDPTVTSNKEAILNGSIKIFPNPTKAFLFIEHNFPEQANFRLFNAQGNEISFSMSNEQTKELDVAGLPAGIYILEITANSGRIAVRKIVKE